MNTTTIDHRTLRELVAAGAVRQVHAIAQGGGWALVVRYGTVERVLASQRSRDVRTWRRLDTLAAYLHDLGLVRFDVDASSFDPRAPTPTPRPDRAQALRRAHEAAEYDQWFRGKVKEALDDARPAVPDDEVRRQAAAWRADLRRQMP